MREGVIVLKFLSRAMSFGAVLAAIPAALFYSVHKAFIQADIFSQLTSEQIYSIFLWSTGVIAVCLALGMFFSMIGKSSTGKTITADNGGIAIDASGNKNSINISK
jgi:hypothetical protein